MIMNKENKNERESIIDLCKDVKKTSRVLRISTILNDTLTILSVFALGLVCGAVIEKKR